MKLRIEGHETMDEPVDHESGTLWMQESSKKVYILLYNYKYDKWCAHAMKTHSGPMSITWSGNHEDPAKAVEGLVPAPPLTIRWE